MCTLHLYHCAVWTECHMLLTIVTYMLGQLCSTVDGYGYYELYYL